MLWNNIKSFQSTQKKHKLTFIFFHPDYTVGFGISPNHAFRLVGYTTGRELHPALKIVIQLRTIIISDIISVNKKFFSRLSKYNNLQAGKHRLFLNILLFGKLHFPTWISPAAIHHTVLQALPATFLFLFLFDINCLWIPYIFLISWWLYSISFYAVLPYFIHSKSATTGSKTAFCSFFDYSHLKTQSFIQKADLHFIFIRPAFLHYLFYPISDFIIPATRHLAYCLNYSIWYPILFLQLSMPVKNAVVFYLSAFKRSNDSGIPYSLFSTTWPASTIPCIPQVWRRYIDAGSVLLSFSHFYP